jgi:hypothetical protein
MPFYPPSAIKQQNGDDCAELEPSRLLRDIIEYILTPVSTTSTFGGWNDGDIPVVKTDGSVINWHVKLEEQESSPHIIAVKDQHAPAQRASAQEGSSTTIIPIKDQHAADRHTPAQEKSFAHIITVTDNTPRTRPPRPIVLPVQAYQ